MQIPHACQALADQLEAARKQLQNIFANPNYRQGPHDPHPGKPDPEMAKEAQAVEAKIRQLNGKLNQCLEQHGISPTEISTFSGTAKLTSPLGHGSTHFSFSVEFLAPHHKHFFVQEFPPMHPVIEGHTLTVTQTGGGHGHFDQATGKLDLQIDLRIDAPSPGGHMDIDITLSTEKPHGKRMDSHGKLVIAGSATGHGSGIGFPSTAEVTLTGDGKISPKP
jgi:hypothetical protein